MAGERRLIDDEWDRARGIQTWHTYDPHTKETTIEVVQDAAPFLEINQRQRDHDVGGAKGLTGRDRKQIKEGMWHFARIPLGVQYHWLKEYGVDINNQDHRPAVFRLLNSPEWKYLKTTHGKHFVK